MCYCIESISTGVYALLITNDTPLVCRLDSNELNPLQAAQTYGRPRAIPNIPIPPTTTETAFFLKVKAHFNDKVLFPPQIHQRTKKDGPYLEFLKCLHLFGVGVLNKDDLTQMLRGLFIQGSSTKSAATAAGAMVTIQAANALIAEFEQLMMERGPYAFQGNMQKYKSKYGSYPLREYDTSDTSKQLTPSYLSYPSDYAFDKSSGATKKDSQVLNFECFSKAKDWDEKEEKMIKSPEDYDGVKARHNAYEEVLCRIEDEMYEVDMAIDRNKATMRLLEPIADEANKLRGQEEKDGQPIGRLQYKIKPRCLKSIHVGAIGRIYGDAGDEVIQHFLRNPLVVVPIVYQRLKEKDAEWRKVKEELEKEWKVTLSENMKGSFDVKCYFDKRAIEDGFGTDHLLEECQKAKSFAKRPPKGQRNPVIKKYRPGFHIDPVPELTLFQPYLSIALAKDLPHEQARGFLAAQLALKDTTSDSSDLSRVWEGLVVPWFGLPGAKDTGGAAAVKCECLSILVALFFISNHC